MNKKLIIFITFCGMFIINIHVYPEGTKQTQPYEYVVTWLFLTRIQSTIYTDTFGVYTADSNHTIHVAIKHPGEKLYMGFNWNPDIPLELYCRIKHNGMVVWGEVEVSLLTGGPGHIDNYSQAVAGPNIINPAGYNPLVFSPSEAGDYIIEFNFLNGSKRIVYYDFTVVDTTILPYKATDGRVWSKAWAFQAGNSSTLPPGLTSSLFIRTNDSIVDSVYFHEFLGILPFELHVNGNGCLPPPTSFQDSRRSRIGKFIYPEYQVFFNNPDSTLFPSGTIGTILPGTSSLIPDCQGHYYIVFSANKAGLIQIMMDINPLPGIQPEDVIIMDSVNAGIDTVFWNGLNGLGFPVPITSTVNIIISFINGLINLPVFCVPANWNGYTVGMKRPISYPPLQFWNDTLIPTGQMELDGCLSTPDTGCHIWQGNQFPPSGFGMYRTINTWWYSANPDTIFNASLSVQVATPDSILGYDTICYEPTQYYSYSLFPNPLPGAQNYEWLLFQDTVFIQSWITSLPYLDSVFFPDTGSYSLISRGYNNCEYGIPDTLQINVFPPDTVSISISSSANEICAGIPVTFLATSINGGSTPSYQWKVNGINQGINDSVFTYSPIEKDTITCVLTSSDSVCISNNPATSNEIILTVYPNLPVSISILYSANPVCDGDTVIFTAYPSNQGESPTFQWFVNGSPVGTNDSIFSYTPVSGDQVCCVLTSSEQCTSNNPATSDTITMVVNPLLPVGITISASLNPSCEGFPVTLTGAAVNGGFTPLYQWQVNGINAGTNNAIFTYTPSNDDNITCTLTSSELCATSNPATSNEITMTVVEAPEVSFTPCFDTITTLNAKPIRLKGGIPLGGTYSGPGVDQITGYFNPAMAGVGVKTITYSCTNVFNCSNYANRNITIVNPAPFTCGEFFTDIRDSTVFPTVQIGSQCWFAANLNYGKEIPITTSQRDNCIPEKYVGSAFSVPGSAFYQWDELMCYDDTPGLQGFCPPGWHVPSEADWNQLFAVYQGNAFAGAPLKYSGYSGFNAFLNGAGFFNKGWWLGDFAVFFWSSTSHGPWKAWAHGMNEVDFSVSYYPSSRANAFAVRCLQD